MSIFLPSTAAAGKEGYNGILVDMSGLSNGVAPTATTISNSAFGLMAPRSSNRACGNTHSSLTGSTGGITNALSTSLFINGVSKGGSSTLSFEYTTGTGGDGCSVTFGNASGTPGAYNSISAGYWFETDLATADSSSHAYDLVQISGAADQCNAQIAPTGSALVMSIETAAGTPSGTITFSRNTVYNVQMQYVSNGTCTVRMFQTNGTELSGSPITRAQKSGSNPATSLVIGIDGAEAEASGSHIWYANVQANIFGTFPLGR
jgi:hypothetical protein